MNARRRCEPVGIAASRCETDAVSGAKVGDCAVALGIGGAVMTSEHASAECSRPRLQQKSFSGTRRYPYPPEVATPVIKGVKTMNS